jgi:hypothetical protein
MQILHKCDNPACVRPDHLFLGTPKVNVIDKMFKGRWRGPVGEAHAHAKLSESDVRHIRRLGKRGWTQQRIADDFGISQRHVSAILRRERWNHI